MAKIRKLNVSEITGTSPYTGDTDAIMPSGTVVVYEKDNNGVIEHVLRVHDGVTNGGVAISPGPGPVIFNGSDGIVRDNLNEGIAAVFNNGSAYITGGQSLRFTGLGLFDGDSTAMLRFWDNEGRHSSGNDPTELVTLNVGNDAAEGDPTEGFFKIVTEKETGGEKEWKFNADGVLTLPVGGDIVDSTGASVLDGGGDANIWIQTFASQDGFPSDVVSLATSVEYDNAGNVIALFSHQTGIGEFNIPSGSYFSVAKFTAAGQKLWQVRLTAGISSVYTDGWGLAVDNVAGRIYVAGRVDDEVGYSKSSLIKLNSEDGSLIWSNVYDFGDRSDSPVVDVDSDGNPVMVGFYSTEVDTNDGVTVTKINSQDGTVVWSRLLDGQNDDEAYGMAVGPNNEVVAVGYMAQYDEPVSHPVTPQTGSGVNVLVINRSDLSGDTLTDAWEVAGTGITGTIGVNAINVYTGLTGTVRQGSGATFDFVIAGDGSITNPVTVANGGTNYLPGHKIKIPYTLIGGADANSDIILTVTGATDGVITSVAAGFYGGGAGSPNNYYSAIGTNYQTGSGLEFDLELDSGSTYTEHPFNITAVGSNYVDGDVVTISGALLGGTSPDNDLTTTVSTSAGGVSTFNSFTGTQQTTTYRVRTDDFDVDFSGTGTWTLSGILVDNDDRMLVVKYSSTGTIAWQKAIQFDAGYACRGADADIDSQGNVYVCGNYDYDANGEQNSAMNLVKFDSSGVKQWSRRVVGDCEDFATSIVVGPDDTLYLNGITSQLVNDTPRFVWVVAKYTTSGTVVWQRLIENTTGWSFSGGGFFNAGGGSNLAVRQGYVALSGGFGEPFFGTSAAAVVQIDADGTVFNVGDWEFKAASFSGTLNSDASDITVIDAGKVDSAIENITVDDTLFATDNTNFLIPTLYSAGGAGSELTNGEYTFALSNTGTVTLPAGGTITEGVVTSNPTIQLTPATPTVASQKLVIKGGAQFSAEDNGIFLTWSEINPQVSDTVNMYVVANAYASQTLYWWIVPGEAGIADPGTGIVEIDGSGNGVFTFTVDSDDYEFTVRVSPENNNYDPDSIGVETQLFNADAPTFGDHHLHLTTGDLTETSIIVGTDDHNVRTTVDGGVEINTYLYPSGGGSGRWTFGNDGNLTLPNNAVIRTDGDNVEVGGMTNFNVEAAGVVNIYTADGTHQWQFGDDGSLTVPGAITQGDAKLSFNENNSTNVYLTPTTDDTSAVFINAVGSQVYGKETVSILGGAGVQAALDLFLENRQLLRDLFDQLQGEPGFPWGITQPAGGDTYDELLSLPSDTFPNQTTAIARANSLNQAYSTYQTLYNNSEVTLAVGDTAWRIDSEGFLNAPNQRFIRFYDEQGAFNGAIGGDNLDHVVFNAGANKGIKVFTDDGTNLWTFGTDGSLTLPAGGDILDSNGDSVLGGSDATGVSRSDDNLIIRLTDPNDDGFELRNILVDGNDANVASTVLGANGFVISTNSNVDQKQWQFGNDGSTIFPNGLIKTQTNQSIGILAIDGGSLSEYPAQLMAQQTSQAQPDTVISSYDNRATIQTDVNGTIKTWTFGRDGSVTFPDSTVQTTAYVPEDNLVKVSGEWTVTAGTNTYSFTVPADGTYIMWVKGNIPNGIITWNATASVSNTNVPAIGTQYAWNYTGGGTPISLTSIPDQIKGVAGTISTDATYAGTTSNRFDFGISNTSGSTQTIYYGYTKIS